MRGKDRPVLHTFAESIGRSSRTRRNACVLERIKLRWKKYWQAPFGPVRIENIENREAAKHRKWISRSMQLQCKILGCISWIPPCTYIFQKIAAIATPNLLWFMMFLNSILCVNLRYGGFDYKLACWLQISLFCRMCTAVEGDFPLFCTSSRYSSLHFRTGIGCSSSIIKVASHSAIYWTTFLPARSRVANESILRGRLVYR